MVRIKSLWKNAGAKMAVVVSTTITFTATITPSSRPLVNAAKDSEAYIARRPCVGLDVPMEALVSRPMSVHVQMDTPEPDARQVQKYSVSFTILSIFLSSCGGTTCMVKISGLLYFDDIINYGQTVDNIAFMMLLDHF